MRSNRSLAVGILVVCAITLMSAAHAATAAAPAKPRIGIVLPKAQLGQGNAGQDIAEPVRQIILAYLAGPAVDLVPLEARIPAQVAAEAQQKGCTHLVYSTVEHKKKGRGIAGLGGMLRGAASVVRFVPGLSSVGGMYTAAAVSSAATQVAMEADRKAAMESLTSSQSGTIKAGDQMSLDFKVQKLGDVAPVVAKTLNGKATADGEDLLSPLVEQMATDVLGAVSKP